MRPTEVQKRFTGFRSSCPFPSSHRFGSIQCERDGTRIDDQLIEAALEMWPEAGSSTGERVCRIFPFSKSHEVLSKRRQKNPTVTSVGDNPHRPLPLGTGFVFDYDLDVTIEHV